MRRNPPDLFDYAAPIARDSDPASSHVAAREHTASGARARQCDLILALVRAHPDRTAAELAAASGGELDDVRCRKRLPDLRAAGRVVVSGQRRCEVAGRLMQTWRAADSGTEG